MAILHSGYDESYMQQIIRKILWEKNLPNFNSFFEKVFG